MIYNQLQLKILQRSLCFINWKPVAFTERSSCWL